MAPRRNDRELIEHMLNYLNEIKLVATEGELASELKINSETANKWLELFLLIKNNCPDFQYKKFGRYRIIDMVGLGGLAQEISQVKLKHSVGTRYRVTRAVTMHSIQNELRRITAMLIGRLKFTELTDWDALIDDSNKVFSEIIDVNVNQLAGPQGNDDEFQIYKSSLKTCLEVFIQSLIDLTTGKTLKPVLALPVLERNFKQKVMFITHKFEETMLKAGKKPDYLTMDEKRYPKPSTSDLMAEMKVVFDDMPNVLQKPNRNDLSTISKKPEFIPFLRCFSCNFERQFPVHCTLSMDYEDGHLICEKCKEIIPIPTCSECNQTLGIGIKELERD
ncbi:MAG: hypothetical protein HZR80_09970 [Candidatus Heimdallarchaeota archaeon]